MADGESGSRWLDVEVKLGRRWVAGLGLHAVGCLALGFKLHRALHDSTCMCMEWAVVGVVLGL